MTLGCLAAYRRLGIGEERSFVQCVSLTRSLCEGAFMLKHVLKQCAAEPTVTSVYLHVQVNNEDALQFYKSFGFEVTETVVREFFDALSSPLTHSLPPRFFSPPPLSFTLFVFSLYINVFVPLSLYHFVCPSLSLCVCLLLLLLSLSRKTTIVELIPQMPIFLKRSCDCAVFVTKEESCVGITDKLTATVAQVSRPAKS